MQLCCLFKTAFPVMSTFIFLDGIFEIQFRKIPVYFQTGFYVSLYFLQNILKNGQTSTETYRMAPGNTKILKN